jgi:hypothetical protein
MCPPPPGPRQLPDLVENLRRAWDAEYAAMIVQMGLRGQIGGSAANYIAAEKRILEEAPLYWVTGEMTDLIKLAAEDLPHDAVLHEIDMPSIYGFVWFEIPIVGMDSDTGGKITVHGFGWGPVLLPTIDQETNEVVAVKGLTFSAYSIQTLDTGDGHPREVVFPAGRSDWQLGTAIDDFTAFANAPGIQPDVTETRSASMMEDRQLVMALWLLLGQTNLTSSRSEITKQTRKRMERAGFTAAAEGVRIVYLHRADHVAPAHTPGTGHQMTVRSITRGHWKMVRYGKGLARRRPCYIAPYLRGPDGAPFVAPKTTVKVLDV